MPGRHGTHSQKSQRGIPLQRYRCAHVQPRRDYLSPRWRRDARLHRRARGPGPWPTAVVLGELFGLTEVQRDAAEHVAAMGYLAVAPDLLHRRAPGGPLAEDDEGRRTGLALIRQPTRLELVSDVRDALETALKEPNAELRRITDRRRNVLRRSRRGARRRTTGTPGLCSDVCGVANRWRNSRFTARANRQTTALRPPTSPRRRKRPDRPDVRHPCSPKLASRRQVQNLSRSRSPILLNQQTRL